MFGLEENSLFIKKLFWVYIFMGMNNEQFMDMNNNKILVNTR